MSWRAACLVAGLTCLTLAPTSGRADSAAPPLVLERRISLAGVAGRIDHMAYDARRGRLLVAELANGSLDVIDIAAARGLHRITHLTEPQGVAYAPVADAILVACGDGTVRFFRADDFTPLGTIALGDDADDVALTADGSRVVVGFGEGGLAVIDPVQRAVTATVRLPAHPEAFRIDARTDRAFVNVPGAREVAVVDLASARHIARWKYAGLDANFPMALDDTRGVLAVVFRSPPRLVMLDAATGDVIARQPTCQDADDVFFDPARHRLYVSCGDGHIDVARWDGSALRPLARIATAPGARTSLFVPGRDRLFVAARASWSLSDAAILIFRPSP